MGFLCIFFMPTGVSERCITCLRLQDSTRAGANVVTAAIVLAMYCSVGPGLILSDPVSDRCVPSCQAIIDTCRRYSMFSPRCTVYKYLYLVWFR